MKKSKHIYDNKNYINESFKNFVRNFSFISKCKFVKCDFSGSNFKESKIFDTEFIDCDFSKCDLVASGLKNTKFSNCNLNGAAFNSSNFVETFVENCSTKNLKIRGTYFKESSFIKFDFGKKHLKFKYSLKSVK